MNNTNHIIPYGNGCRHFWHCLRDFIVTNAHTYVSNTSNNKTLLNILYYIDF